ncbi:MAG: ABC transporter permease subunit [Myxococcales bacterium]|nr:ABC transporter permease subunit [Myxococcales bacterium]
MFAILAARVYAQTVVFRSRSAWLAIAVLVSAAVAIPLGQGNPGKAFPMIARELTLGFLMPLFAMLFGTAVIREDIERGTLGYWLTRPIHRRTYLLSRFGVAWAAVFTLTAVGIVLDSIVLAAPTSQLLTVLLATAGGSLAYTAFFTALGALVKRPFVVGVVAMLFIDAPVSQLPMAARYLTIRGHVENLGDISWIPPQFMSALLDAPSPIYSAAVLAGVAGAALALALLKFQRSEFTGAET